MGTPVIKLSDPRELQAETVRVNFRWAGPSLAQLAWQLLLFFIHSVIIIWLRMGSLKGKKVWMLFCELSVI